MRKALLGALLGLVGCGAQNPPDLCADGGCSRSQYAVCAEGLQPTFSSINAGLFKLSCGGANARCHGEANYRDLNLVPFYDSDLADGGSLTYQALVGNGSGAPAANIGATVDPPPELYLVVPGDPDHSFLLQKLQLHVKDDPNFGAGMPLDNPGSVCPDTVRVVRAWIAAGAPAR